MITGPGNSWEKAWKFLFEFWKNFRINKIYNLLDNFKIKTKKIVDFPRIQQSFNKKSTTFKVSKKIPSTRTLRSES